MEPDVYWRYVAPCREHDPTRSSRVLRKGAAGAKAISGRPYTCPCPCPCAGFGPPAVRSAIGGRTTRHIGYDLSQRVRKRVEQIWGWMKTAAAFRKTRDRGLARNRMATYLIASAYNLLRIARLTPGAG